MNANTSVLETVTRAYIGKTLTHAMLEALVIASVPAWKDKLTSLNISDHAPSARQKTQYADHLFDKTTGGYTVRTNDRIARKPATTGRNRGPVDHAAELRAAQALLTPVPAKDAGKDGKGAAAPVIAPVVIAAKSTDAAKPTNGQAVKA